MLLGYHDVSAGDVVIVDALPAPPDSEHCEGHFVRGVDGLLDAYKDVQRRTGNIVGYLGKWHSHPPGHSARPSGDDILQLFKLALGMVDEGLPVTLALPSIRGTLYPKASNTSSPPCLLRLLPAGAVAGRGLHPLESAAFARRTPVSHINSTLRCASRSRRRLD